MPQHNHYTQPMRLPNEKLLPEVVALLADGRTVTIPLRGISMRPYLEDGRDKAVLALPTDLRVGDVVLAEVAKGRYVLHRLVGLDGDIATLRGDGNRNTETCRRSDIKAKAAAFVRKGRSRAESTDSLKWRTYSWLWTRLLPLRRYLLYAYKHLYLRK